ncbi:MAG: glycosyltransferase family 4 protein [Deltaproteobacteria bacterium]|nr:glycosyltransferase family 4 protein [Deltaproteobacteria bacterium]
MGTEKKGIVFIVSGKSPITLPGGLGAYSNNLANIFRKLGFRVFVLGFSKQAEEIEKNGITFIHIKTPFNWLRGLGVGFITPYFLRALMKKVEEYNPPEIIVFGMATWNYVGYKIKLKLKQRNIKTLASCFTTHKHELKGNIRGAQIKDYGYLPHFKYMLAYVMDRLFIQYFDKKAITEADKVIVHYESTRKIIEDDYGPFLPGKILRIPYCVEIYKRTSEEQKDKGVLHLGKKRPWVVVICRQDPRKGINTFIKAVGILKKQALDFDCYIIGSGPFLRNNERLTRRLGLERDIQFLGFVDDIKLFLEEADAYVLPSVEEGSGAISLLEAMKLGVPIVTTRCDGIPEDFTHERNALLVDMHDEQDMADQIKRILEDGKLKMKLSENAKRDYNKKFTFEKMSQEVERVINNLWREENARA